LSSSSVSRAAVSLCALLLLVGGVVAQGYRKPPQGVLDVLNSPVTPSVSISPARDQMLLATGVRYPPISDLAQPMLRLAGYRINPNTNGRHLAPYFVALSLKRIADGAETKVELPPGAQVGLPQWSPDGKRFAFTNTVANGIELWVGDAVTGRATKIKNVLVNAAFGDALEWMPDGRTLLVQLVPAARARLAPPSNVPREPNIQESSGRAGPVRTYQDLLRTPYDEEMFDYYATAQLALVDTGSGRATNVGQPAIFDRAAPAPDGRHLLVARIKRPYSFLHTANDFPQEVEVWDTRGKLIHKLASTPLQDQVPIDGVPTGPRSHSWRPTEPATLVWVEALDEGDPKKKVPHRDRVLMLKAPFAGAPVELMKLEDRYAGMTWFERGGLAFASDYNRDTRRVRTQLVNADTAGVAPRVIWHRNMQDRYNDPGAPMMRVLPSGHRAIIYNNDQIFLLGGGASNGGDRPFLDRYNVTTQKAERLFRSDEKSYETVVTLLRDDGAEFITRRETPIEPGNYFLRSIGDRRSDPPTRAIAVNDPNYETLAQPITQFPDPAPQLRDIKKQLVTYKRADGVQLSFTLYLPPGYKEGTRLPTVVWAYPLEFTDAATAGQVSGSTQRFTTIGGPSHLFYLLNGYAVLDNTTMPVVGDPETVNNTYVEQIVSSAKAAIDKATEMGVTDPERVGVGGHS
jgi:dipeptidyl aminopeptidase/acylaminoacyl peptidase